MNWGHLMVIINPFQSSFECRFSLSRPMLSVFPVLFPSLLFSLAALSTTISFAALEDGRNNQDNIRGNTK